MSEIGVSPLNGALPVVLSHMMMILLLIVAVPVVVVAVVILVPVAVAVALLALRVLSAADLSARAS